MTRSTHSEPPQASQPFLGRYQLQKKLAVGGMAEIYLAQSSGAGGFTKQVVVKRILPQLAESEELFQMFLDEARIAATLQHANIVQVYDACEEGGEFFMAMEYLDGTDLRTLRRVLADNKMAIGWEHSLHVVSSIASGLHYAHEKCAPDGSPLRIVHRDVSPQNIFLTREGSVKLVDFGIAQAEGRTTETAMGTLKGKLAYMAPEQCASHKIDRRADIYSLGVILYELTTGRRLYSSKTEYQLINEIVEGKIRVPSSFMDYPAELESIVLRCLQKDPNDRYKTAREIQADLDVFARDYQLICSTLGFSIFIEPLLEKATLAAEERWKHRKEIRPVSRRGRGLQSLAPSMRSSSSELLWLSEGQSLAAGTDPTVPTPEPAHSAAEEQETSRADEIIEDFLSTKHKAAPRRMPRGTSTPLAVDTSYISTRALSRANALDDLTRPVPSDVLQRLRSEERERTQSERDAAEQDAVPRLARGSISGDLSVSNNVVRRDATRSAKAKLPLPVTTGRTKLAAPLDPAEVYVDFVDDDEQEKIEFKPPAAVSLRPPSAPVAKPKAAPLPMAAKSTKTAPLAKIAKVAKSESLPLPKIAKVAKVAKSESLPLPKVAEPKAVPLPAATKPEAAPAPVLPPLPELEGEARVATALVLPSEFIRVADEDISIKPKRGKLWIGLGSIAGAGIAAALILGGSSDSKGNAPTQQAAVMPEFGSLLVEANSEAKVWIFLGKTPISTLTLHSEASHLIRVEHEGYRGKDLELGPATWKRDSNGTRYAEAKVNLLPKDSPEVAPESEAKDEGSGAGRPANLRVSSSPAAANAWLYVGSTPNLRIKNLPTDERVELRITRGSEPPMYRVVDASQFDASGQANLKLLLAALPKAAAPLTPSEAPGAGTTPEESPARGRKWRPKHSTRKQVGKHRGEMPKTSSLEHPTPDWAK